MKKIVFHGADYLAAKKYAEQGKILSRFDLFVAERVEKKKENNQIVCLEECEREAEMLLEHTFIQPTEREVRGKHVPVALNVEGVYNSGKFGSKELIDIIFGLEVDTERLVRYGISVEYIRKEIDLKNLKEVYVNPKKKVNRDVLFLLTKYKPTFLECEI